MDKGWEKERQEREKDRQTFEDTVRQVIDEFKKKDRDNEDKNRSHRHEEMSAVSNQQEENSLWALDSLSKMEKEADQRVAAFETNEKNRFRKEMHDMINDLGQKQRQKAYDIEERYRLQERQDKDENQDLLLKRIQQLIEKQRTREAALEENLKVKERELNDLRSSRNSAPGKVKGQTTEPNLLPVPKARGPAPRPTPVLRGETPPVPPAAPDQSRQDPRANIQEANRADGGTVQQRLSPADVIQGFQFKGVDKKDSKGQKDRRDENQRDKDKDKNRRR